MNHQINPYKITAVTLITYSGRHERLETETDWLSIPLHTAKEKLLDDFVRMTPNSRDPFVKIHINECQTMFNH